MKRASKKPPPPWIVVLSEAHALTFKARMMMQATGNEVAPEHREIVADGLRTIAHQAYLMLHALGEPLEKVPPLPDPRRGLRCLDGGKREGGSK